MDLAKRGFDYGDLNDSEQRHLERQAEKLADIRDRVTRSAIETGRILAEARARLANRGNGTFERWVEERCGMSPRHARRFIAVAERIADKLSDNVVRFFEDSSLFLLSEPSCPESAVNEAMRLADKGKVVTHKLAKSIVEKHKPASGSSGYTAHGIPGGEKSKSRKGPAEPEPAGQPADGRGGVGTASDAGPSAVDAGEDIDASYTVNGREVLDRPTTVIETTGRVIGEAPKLTEILAAINHASHLIDRYAASDEGRELPIDKATKAIRDLKSAVAGGGTSQVIAEDVAIDASLDTPDVRSALNDWLIYKRKRNQPYKDAGQVALQMKRWIDTGPAAFIAAVEYSIAQNYQGITPDKANSAGSVTSRKTAAPSGAVNEGSFGETYDPFAA